MGSSLISHPKNTVATLNAYKMHWLHLSLYTVLRFELQAAKTNLSSAAKSKLMAHYVWNQLGSSCVFTPHRSISHDRSARFQTGHFIAANESMRLCRSIRDDLNGPYPDGQKPLADASRDAHSAAGHETTGGIRSVLSNRWPFERRTTGSHR